MGMEEIAEAAEGAGMAGTGAGAALGAIADAMEIMTPEGLAVAAVAQTAAMTSTGQRWMRREAKRLKRVIDDRFRPKRLLEDFEHALSPAHKSRTRTPRSGMPRRPTKPGPRRAKKAKKVPVTKRRTSTKKKAKSKRKTKTLTKNVVHKQQPHGQGTRDDVLYMGFQHHGGRDELMEVVVDSVFRKYLQQKFAISIDNPDVSINVAASTPMMSKLRLAYSDLNYDTGAPGSITAGTMLDLTTVKYQQMVGLAVTEIKTQAAAGKFPEGISFYNNADQIVYFDRRVGDCMVDVTCGGKIKIRNITPNDSAATDGATAGDRFALDTNPLQGKLYTFNGDIPIVKNTLREPQSDSAAGTQAQIRAAFAKFMDTTRAMGICGTTLDSSTDPPLKTKQILSTPPVGSKIWSNCKSTKSVVLAPGSAAGHSIRFGYKGSLNRFLRNVVGNGVNDYTKIGNCTWIGLEQMYSSRGGIGGGHDKIRIEYDCHYTLRCGTRLKPAERSPATVDEGTINL